ncbi:hypothetical protein [Ferdinandcohnia sp. SAFN-114]|uniref:hypothetical protein n=1 Tax=Ferdinandcohnia sp. SAFN-114 TaxID=3387275 RepID=UPI003F7D383C
MGTIYLEKVKELEIKVNAYKEISERCEAFREAITISTLIKNTQTGAILAVTNMPKNEIFFIAGNLETGDEEKYYYLNKDWEIFENNDIRGQHNIPIKID